MCVGERERESRCMQIRTAEAGLLTQTEYGKNYVTQDAKQVGRGQNCFACIQTSGVTAATVRLHTD